MTSLSISETSICKIIDNKLHFYTIIRMGLSESGHFGRYEFSNQLSSMTSAQVFKLLEAENKTLAEFGVQTPISKLVYWGYRRGGSIEHEGGRQIVKITPTNCLNALLHLEPNLKSLNYESFKKLEGSVTVIADSYERLKEIKQGFFWPDPFYLSPVLFSRRN